MAVPAHPPARCQVEWDDARAEPYILLPGQPDFRLTPLRPGDEDGGVRLCNDPLVGRWAYRRPFPYVSAWWEGTDDRYARKDAEWWFDLQSKQYPTLFAQVREALHHGGPAPVHNLHFVLRHVPAHADADEELAAYLAEQGIPAGDQLGSMHLWPSESEGLTDDEMRALPPREQVWEIGYDMLPLLQGRGLGRRMIQAAMKGWIGWLGIGTVIAVRVQAQLM